MVDIKHKFVSEIADDPTAEADGEVLPSNWNDSHDLKVSARNKIIGRIAGGSMPADAEEIDYVPNIDSLLTDCVYWMDSQDQASGGYSKVDPLDTGAPLYTMDKYSLNQLNGTPPFYARTGNGNRLASLFGATTHASIPSIDQVDTCDIFIVLKQDDDTGDQVILQNDVPADNPQFIYSSGVPKLIWNATNLTHSTTTLEGDWHIIKISLTSSQIAIGIDGATAETTSHSETDLGIWTRISDAEDVPFLGSVGEVMIFNATLGGTDSQTIIDYLKVKWGIA